jgi:DNA invertase Pin-like site-specific DNA recombinase
MQKYVPYVRVSSKRQGDSGLGLEAQVDAVKKYADSKSGEIVREPFVEVETGTKDRVVLRTALAYARRTKSTLVVAKLDRIARDMKLFCEIRDSGTNVVFLDLPDVPPGPVGQIMLTMLAAFAEFEAKVIQERTRSALGVLKRRGVKLGAAREGARRLTESDRAAGRKAASASISNKAVKRNADILPVVLGLREDGMPLSEIGEFLAENYGSRTASGQPFDASRVAKLVRMAKNAGVKPAVPVLA